MWRSKEIPVKILDSNMPDINDLMTEKQNNLLELKNLVSDDLNYTTNFHLKDNFYLLRYVLSYKGDATKAAEAIRRSIEWRSKNMIFVKKAMTSDHKSRSINFPEHMKPYLRAFQKYLSAWGHKSTRNGQPVVICRMETCNFNALSQLVPPHIIQDYILFSNEVEFWECDRLSRTTGKLHKAYRLIDLKNLSLRTLDRTFLNSFSQSSNISEFLHPQLVGKTIFINSPSILRIILEIVKRLGISRRALDKIWSFKPQPNKDTVDEVITKIIDINDIPKFMGGNCNCKNGCLPIFNLMSKPTDSNSETPNEIDQEIEHINSYRPDEADSKQLNEQDLTTTFPELLELNFSYDDPLIKSDNISHELKSVNSS